MKDEASGQLGSGAFGRGDGHVDVSMSSTALLSALWRRSFARRVSAETWPGALEIRPPMYGVMQVLAVRGPQSQRELADAVLAHASDMVVVIDALESAGLVRRDRDPADRRRHQVVLTTPGSDVLSRLHALAQDADDEVLAPLDESERETFRTLSDKAASQLVQRSGPAHGPRP